MTTRPFTVRIAAIRLGDCYADMDIMCRPVDPKRLH